MIRRPPRSTLDRSSAASDVYKRQRPNQLWVADITFVATWTGFVYVAFITDVFARCIAVSYTHLRAHETVLDLVCRLLLEKKKNNTFNLSIYLIHYIVSVLSLVTHSRSTTEITYYTVCSMT